MEFRNDGTIRAPVRRSKADPYGLGRIASTSTRTAALVQEWLDWRSAEISYVPVTIQRQS